MKTYSTAQVAEIIGVHPNTVRLYEQLELIPKARRKANGYRVFTEQHIDVFRIARIAFDIVILQSGLRKKMISMVKTAAAGDYDTALSQTDAYIRQVKREMANAREAVRVVEQILSGMETAEPLRMKRKETAEFLEISMDTLRNWEMNGLFSVKRRENGYRVYTGEDIDRLKIIRSLRCANYSLEAILRMLSALSKDPQTDIARALDSPQPEEDTDTVLTACDKLQTSLKEAEGNAETIRAKLLEMREKY